MNSTEKEKSLSYLTPWKLLSRKALGNYLLCAMIPGVFAASLLWQMRPAPRNYVAVAAVAQNGFFPNCMNHGRGAELTIHEYAYEGFTGTTCMRTYGELLFVNRFNPREFVIRTERGSVETGLLVFCLFLIILFFGYPFFICRIIMNWANERSYTLLSVTDVVAETIPLIDRILRYRPLDRSKLFERYHLTYLDADKKIQEATIKLGLTSVIEVDFH